MDNLKYVLFPFLYCISSIVLSQKIVINDDAYLVLSNAVYVVLDNSDPTALSTDGTGGNIISENEENVIQWNINNTIGTYTVPFTTETTDTKIPISIEITSNGSNDGHILFSTYETTNDDNTPWASDVTHMDSQYSVDASLYVVDRFWRVDANSYTNKPGGHITFSYDDASNEIAETNVLNEVNLIAQYFDSDTDDWSNPIGNVNAVTNIVSGATFTSSSFFKTWTLVDNSNVLPVQFYALDAVLENGHVVLKWKTLIEVHNNYFVVEKSIDNSVWEEIGVIEGAGISMDISEYQFVDIHPFQINYYRLKQVDYDGSIEYSNVITHSLDLEKTYIYPNPVKDLLIIENTSMNFILTDVLGKKIDIQPQKNENSIAVNVSTFQKGFYILKFENGSWNKFLKE